MFAAILLAGAGSAAAQTPRLSASNQQVRALVTRIETKTDRYRRQIQNTINRSPINNTDREDRIMDLVSDFEQSTNTLRARFDSRQAMGGEVADVLNKGSQINAFMTRNRITGAAATQWVSLRTDLNTLARYYNVSWNWNQPIYTDPTGPVYTATDTQLRTLIAQIENKTDVYKRQMGRSLDRRNVNNNVEDSMNSYVARFEEATNSLRDNFNARRSTSADTTEVLTRARFIDQFMAQNRMNRNAENQWTSIRNDLNTLASYYRVSWNWNQPIYTEPTTPVYTATDTQLRNLIGQIENKTDVYKRQMGNALDRPNVNSNVEDSMNSYVARFEEATNRLRDNFNGRRSTDADATEVLSRARFIDQFMTQNRMNRNAENQWSSIRNDLNTLATYYRVSWDWNQQLPGYPVNNYPVGGGILDGQLTGTYRLNSSLSDNVAAVINRSVSAGQRQNMRQGLERRLASPEMIAIDQRGRTIIMSSTNAPQITFDADGVARSETNPRGRTVTTTASMNNSGLVINYEGDRMNDFYVTFAPSGNNRMNVTRRIYIENSNETITVSSVYDRTSNSAQWSTVNTGPAYGGTTGGINDFYIPNGTRLTAVLRSTINTRASQIGDRFTMEVTSPGQYRGAMLEGRVAEAERSGRVTGRANISLDFDTLRMNGQTYRFAGIIDSVTAANGDNVSVNNEGTVRDGSQTTQTVARAGIGAILGAVIGAIAGGGQGAAIGAGVGAGAGAGSVLISGRDNLELGPGSTVSLTATAPAGVANR